jgi:hypothetical protein
VSPASELLDRYINPPQSALRYTFRMVSQVLEQKYINYAKLVEKLAQLFPYNPSVKIMASVPESLSLGDKLIFC